jgi:hypothetical protein
MSPTPESASSNPRKPDRKSSSSALLTAFKNLTTGRSPSAPQVPPLPTIPTPRSNAAPHNHADADGSLDASAIDSRVEGLDRPVSEPDKIADSAAGNGDLHGALDELKSLLPSLGAERPLSGRLRGASDIASFLNKYPVKDVLPIWVAGSDLLRKSNPDDAVRAGFVLLVSCIKASKSLVERNLFWESLVSYEGSNNVDLRLQALIEVTDQGRAIESFESGLPGHMAQLLKDAFNDATKARSTNQRNRGSPAEEQTLEKTFHFAVDVVRFNPVDLKDEGYKVVIDQVKCICQKTISKVDIANGLLVMGAVVTYTSIPFATFRPCFELLCQIYKQLESQREQTWTVVKRVLRSHLRIDAIDHLLLILSSKDDGQPAFHPNTIHGAFFILRDLTENDGANDLPNVTLTTFSPAVNKALRRTQDAGLRTDVLKFYKFVFGNPALKVHMIDNVDWTYFIGSLEQCSTTCKSLPSNDAKTTPPPAETIESEAGSVFNDLIDGLCREFPSLSIVHQEETVRLLFKLENHLSDYSANALVEYISSQPILSTIAGNDYRSIWKHLTGYFAHETSRPQAIRRRTYSYLVDTFDALQYLSEEDVLAFTDLLLEGFATEEDAECLDTLAIFVGKALTSTHRDSLFDSIMLKVRQSVFHRATRNSSPYSSGRSQASTPIPLEKGSQPSLCRIVVRHIIRLFLTTLNQSAQCAETLYHFILDVARSSTCDADARICALKLLFRLRCTSDYRIYVVSVSESESIAAVLCRTLDTAVQANWIDAGEQSKESRITSGNHPRTRSVRLSKPVPPLWFYPGPKGLPQEPFEAPSLVAYAANPEQSPRDTKTAVLPLTLWLETVLSLLQEPDVDWEIYSYVLVHLGAQLKNRTLFTSAVPHIKLLRSVICDQIRSQSFHDPPSHTLLRKADVAVCLFHVLTMLIGYSAWFAKSEDDEIVRSFMLGIGSWDGTSKWCIHALSVCCHEVPLSVSKSLDGIIQKMSQIITQPQIAIHILEFLCCLSRLPHVYSNFREDEYKMVFGVSFRYLQSVRDRKQRDEDRLAPPTAKSNKRHSDSIREVKLTAEADLRGSGPSDDLPQYVYALAFHVITFWFMALKLRDRPAYVPWIARNLMYQDRSGKEVIEDQGMVTLDMMERVAYTDRDETIHNAAFAQPTDGEVAQCTWITGLSLLTIETAGRTGLSQLAVRRPVSNQLDIGRF